MNIDLPCPVCGFKTFEENYGSYVICEICGWEDDGVQLANPCSEGGANKESLAEAQEKALAKYPLNVQLAEGYKRSHQWRPLTKEEIEEYKIQKSEKYYFNKAVLYESETYWAKDS